MPESYSVAQYVEDLRRIHRTGAATPETAFYPPVDRLFNDIGAKLKPKVDFVTQLRNQGAGMPDGGFFLQRGRGAGKAESQTRNPDGGAVEIKPASWSLNELTKSEQTARYLKQYGVVLITNLREFRLLARNPDGTPRTLERYVLAVTEDDLWYRPVDAKHNALLPEFLSRTMLHTVPLMEPKQVARLLASYAREARARAEEHDLPAFRNVKQALEESLGIEFEGEKGEHFFRSTLVQTLFYGIFSAWVLWRHSPEYKVPNPQFNWKLSDDYLKVPVLRKLFREVSDRRYLNTIQLTEILDWAGEALNRVRPQLFDIFQGEQAVAYFYEPFLEAFDPQLRKELGVWYTPREIVQYQVERVDHLLRTELGQELGLASDAVRILDPCCGTGAYLTAVLQRIHKTLQEEAGDDTAYVPGKLRTAALTRVFGFEIMPAPFVIAHMEIARLLEDAGAPLLTAEQLQQQNTPGGLKEDQRAGIFLTNALTGWVPTVHPKVLFTEMEEEREAADTIKQQGTILVILGNPPYNGYAGIAKIEEERGLTTAYRTTIKGLPAPQGQGLNDLYIRFFRIAERRITANTDGKGVVSFISNNAWLDGLSHTTMRHHYLQAFQQIYIDNLNGDKYRTGKTTPEGKPDPSAFSTAQNREGIQVGTAIATLVRNTAKAGSQPQIRDLWGAGKLSHLERESRREGEPVYAELRPVAALGNPLAHRVHSAAYTSWPKLPELFPVSFPGVKTSRDFLVIDIDKEKLVSRIKRYLDAEVPDEEIARSMSGAMKDSERFDATEVRKFLQDRPFRGMENIKKLSAEKRREIQSQAYRSNQIRRYIYRPFDVRWLYWEPETKLLDEKREEYVQQITDSRKWVEVRQREAGDTFCRGSVSVQLSDQYGNGMSHFFPETIFLPDSLYENGKREEPNVSKDIETLALSNSMDLRDLFFHALAIMHTPQYRTENAGALLGDWPRIPLPATAELLAHSAGLGRRLAELLDAESKVKLGKEWSYLARLEKPSTSHLQGQKRTEAEARALLLTAGWGSRGQGSTVMPGRGKVAARAWTAEERGKLTALAAGPDGRRGLTLDEALGLLGEGCVDVFLNVSPDGGSRWVGVPAKVWSYTLGGYQVLKKWLSYREGALLGRALREDEAAWFAEVARRVAAILLLGPALDASYRATLPGATGLKGRGNTDSLP